MKFLNKIYDEKTYMLECRNTSVIRQFIFRLGLTLSFLLLAACGGYDLLKIPDSKLRAETASIIIENSNQPSKPVIVTLHEVPECIDGVAHLNHKSLLDVGKTKKGVTEYLITIPARNRIVIKLKLQTALFSLSQCDKYVSFIPQISQTYLLTIQYPQNTKECQKLELKLTKKTVDELQFQEPSVQYPEVYNSIWKSKLECPL